MAKDFWRANHPHKSTEIMQKIQFLDTELTLQESVAKVFNEVIGHRSGRQYDKQFYIMLSKKCGFSPRSLKQFLESGRSLRKAATILYRLGYRISKISVEKLSEK